MTLDHDTPNLAQVVPGLYRGGQPKDAAAWEYLRSLGCNAVIKLNTEPGDEESGMIVQRFPITTPQQIWGPVKAQLYAALAAIAPGTYIHCEAGENRTGTLVILYRVKVCGWTKDMAIAEAKKFEWEWSLPALQIFVEEL
jgi:protein tyrosine/serine phosphatase